MRLPMRARQRASDGQSGRAGRFKLWALLPAVIIVGLLGVGMPARAQAAPAPLDPCATAAATPADADTFMCAIVAQDGARAWRLLCPALQAKVPAATLASLTSDERVNKSGQTGQLGVDSVGAHAWAAGGQIHVYVLTVHWSSGDDAYVLYALRTQASGCIDGILRT